MTPTTPAGITLLWALRSPCNLGCRYCYFGILNETTRRAELPYVGALTHLGTRDASPASIWTFAGSLAGSHVCRVFLAGGEPLLWKELPTLVSILKRDGIEVVLCTNGLPLVDQDMVDWIISSGIDAVSVSLDSHDPAYNDKWRVDNSGLGWKGVIAGLRRLIGTRVATTPKVGLYMVVTRGNYHHIIPTAELGADLGVDYFIIQPISLRPQNELVSVLSLEASDRDPIAQTIEQLLACRIQCRMPNSLYLSLFVTSIDQKRRPEVKGCFGGRDLFFIEPDGSVWDCPSCYKIEATPADERFSISHNSVGEIFSTLRRSRNTDCGMFSQDCVNMWQLMAFDDILHNTSPNRYELPLLT